MSRSNAITFSRLALTVVFIVVYFIPASGTASAVLLAALWAVAVVAELTDYFDGWTARKYNEVTEFGKVFDPFADVMLHLSVFFCLCWDRALPLPFVLVVLFREQTMTLVRLLSARRGVMVGARAGGKLKTVLYVCTGGAALARVSLRRLGALPSLDAPLGVAVIVLCVLAGALALASLADYLVQYRKLAAKSP
jgi:CDP-diacylglycerol--glycerol-3-phosphate 3-phosphatidyltransferase